MHGDNEEKSKYTKPPIYAYILAVISGGLVSSLLTGFSKSIYILMVMNMGGYFIAAIIFGYIWPAKSWRWGLWIVSLMFVMVGISVAFTGLGSCFSKDLPGMFALLVIPCVGGFLGAWFRGKRTISKNNLL